MVTPIQETDILTAVIDAEKGEGEKNGIAYTKDIVLLMGERFPDVHMMAVLAIMGRLKKRWAARIRSCEHDMVDHQRRKGSIENAKRK